MTSKQDHRTLGRLLVDPISPGISAQNNSYCHLILLKHPGCALFVLTLSPVSMPPAAGTWLLHMYILPAKLDNQQLMLDIDEKRQMWRFLKYELLLLL